MIFKTVEWATPSGVRLELCLYLIFQQLLNTSYFSCFTTHDTHLHRSTWKIVAFVTIVHSVSECVCACLEGTCQQAFQTQSQGDCCAPAEPKPPKKQNKTTLFITPLKTQTLLPLFSTSFRFSLPPLLLSFLNHTLQPYDLSSLTWTRSILFWFKRKVH